MPYMPAIRELRHSLNGVLLMAFWAASPTRPRPTASWRAASGRRWWRWATPAGGSIWPGRAKRRRGGRAGTSVTRLSCNTCWAAIIMMHVPIACVNNPRVGRPDEASTLSPAQLKHAFKRVVVGRAHGIAGMEAALGCRRTQGHSVTVFGALRPGSAARPICGSSYRAAKPFPRSTTTRPSRHGERARGNCCAGQPGNSGRH